ncbi:MAG: hypothetical protein JXR86_11470 [Spirochaetales bacterium]|nr:hypothetical protein [Spirochaetales bacterium]
MKKNKFELIGLMALAFMLFITACSNPLVEDLPKDEDPQETTETDVDTSYVDGVLSSLKADLIASSSARVASSWDNNLTIAEIDAIIAAARAKVQDQDLLESTNLAAFLPLVLEGAQSQLSATPSASTTAVKMNIIGKMVSSTIDVIAEEIGSEAGKTSLMITVTETVIKNIPGAGVGADEIGDVAGGAISIVTSTTESLFTIDSISNVVSSIASSSIQALSVAYNNASGATADDVKTGVSVVTGSILSEVQTFASLEGNALGETMVDVTGSVNSSIGILAGNLGSGVLGADVTTASMVTGLAGTVISTVTDKILEIGTDNDGDFLKEVISGTISALAADSGDISTLAKEVTSIAVQSAAAANTADLTGVITDIVESVAEAVTTADSTAVVATIIAEGLSDSGEDTSGVNVDQAVSDGQTAAANAAPVITSLTLSQSSVTVNPGSGQTVTVTVAATDSNGDTLTYNWDLSSALSIISGDGTAVITVSVPDFTGDFTITAIVSDGYKSVRDTAFLTVLADTSETDEEAAARLVLEARNALNLENFTEALNLFEEAKTADPANTEAALFWAILNIGSTLVDPKVQEVIAAAGILGYPETMEEFITSDWTKAMPVMDGIWKSYSGDIQVVMGVYTNLYPEINIPEGFDSLPFYGLDLEDAPELSLGEYMNIIAYNFQNSYPDGFNTPVTNVVNLVKEKLDGTISALEGIASNDSISLEADMFMTEQYDPFTSLWPTDGNDEPMAIVIGEAEVLLSVASLQIVNSLLNSVLAVDLSVDLAAFYSAFNMKDGLFWDATYLADQREYDWNEELESAYHWSSLPQKPFASGFLQTSADSDTVMAASKQYMSDALANLAAAADDLQARTGTESSFTFSEAKMDSWATVKEVVDVAAILVDKLNDSLTNNKSVVIPGEILMGSFTGYDVETNWPATADWSGVAVIDDIFSADMAINMSKLFEKPIFALDNLIELDSFGEPVLYSENSGSYSAVTSYTGVQAIADMGTDKKFAVKVKDITFGGLVDIPGSVIESILADLDLPSYIADALDQKVDATTGAISYYYNIIEPSAVFSALNTVGSKTTEDTTLDYYVEATGSFWYALVPMIEGLTERVLDGNDTVDEAIAVLTDGTVYDRTLTYNDNDYFSFSVTDGTYYKVSLAVSDSFDTSMTVEDLSDNFHARNASYYDNEQYNYDLVFLAGETGTYILTIDDSSNLYERDYSFSISEASPYIDGNDDISEAVALTIDGAMVSSDLNSIDSDFYEVSLTAGEAYRFDVSNIDTDNYSFALLTDSEYPLAYGSSYNTSDYSKFMYYQCDTTGTYYLKVNDDYVSSAVPYDISASTVFLNDDGNGDFSTAQVLVSNGDSISAGLTIFDEDFYSLEALANTTYTIQVNGNPEDWLWTYVYIYGSDGSYVSSEWGDLDSGITHSFAVTEAGTYYINVFSSDNYWEYYSDYTINLTNF